MCILSKTHSPMRFFYLLSLLIPTLGYGQTDSLIFFEDFEDPDGSAFTFVTRDDAYPHHWSVVAGPESRWTRPYEGSHALALNANYDEYYREYSAAVSPTFDFSGLDQDPIITLFLKQSFAGVDKHNFNIEISTDGGNTWRTPWRGDVSRRNIGVFGGFSPTYELLQLTLKGTAGQAQVQFRFSIGTQNDDENKYWGLIIDNVSLRTPGLVDLAITEFDRGNNFWGFTQIDYVTAKIRNDGLTDVSQVPLAWQAISDGDTLLAYDTLASLSVGYGKIFTCPIPLDAERNYTITLQVAAAEEVWQVQNEASLRDFGPLPNLQAVPYTQDFEQSSEAATYTQAGWVAPLSAVYFDATRELGYLTLSTDNPYSGNRSLCLSGSDFDNNQLIFTVNALAYSAMDHPLILRFAHYQEQAVDPEGTAQVFVRGAPTDAWVAVKDLSNLPTATWNFSEVDLSSALLAKGQSFSGRTQILFDHRAPYPLNPGLCIDDLEVVPAPFNATVTDLKMVGVKPYSPTGQDTVRITVANSGTDTLQPFPWACTLVGRQDSTTTQGFFTQAIPPGQTDSSYVLVDLRGVVTRLIGVAQYPGDLITGDDILNIPNHLRTVATSLPVIIGFDSLQSQYVPSNFSIANIPGLFNSSSFTVAVSKSSSYEGTVSVWPFTQPYSVELTVDLAHKTAGIDSVWFGFWLKGNHAQYGLDYGTDVYVRAHPDSAWVYGWPFEEAFMPEAERLDRTAIGQPREIGKVLAAAGQPFTALTQVKIEGYPEERQVYGGQAWIDNLWLVDELPQDLKLQEITLPTNLHQTTAEETVQFRITNRSEATVRPILVFTMTSTTDTVVYRDTVEEPLNPKQTRWYTLSTPVDFSQRDTYRYQARVFSSLDYRVENDVLGGQLQVNPPIKVPYFQTFDDVPTQVYSKPVTPLGMEGWQCQIGSINELRIEPASVMEGSPALTLRKPVEDGKVLYAGALNLLTLVVDHAGKSIATDSLYLTFRHRQIENNTRDEGVFIRGTLGDPWLRVSGWTPGSTGSSLMFRENLNQVLAAGGQEYSSTTQIQWRELSYLNRPHLYRYEQLILDDIAVVTQPRDIAITHLSTYGPATAPHDSVTVSLQSLGAYPTILQSLSLQVTHPQGSVETYTIPLTATLDVFDTLEVTIPNVGFATTGGYSLLATVSAINDNHADNDTLSLQLPTVTQLPPPIRELVIYPQPAQEQITVDGQLPRAMRVGVQLTDLQGRVLQRTEVASPAQLHTTLSVAHIPNGLYLLTLIMEGQPHTRQVVIHRE